ncbi:MAG: amidohydrolase family protein [Armatimonadota bacterium]|jgi:predicted TIM-barrel fold metal-dependent hydrolase
MIIDADVHISPTSEGGNSILIDEALRRMDRCGVDKALIWLQPPYGRELSKGNAYVHQATLQHPDRFLGFGWADPNLGVEKARDTVRRCTDDYGFYGVKLNGAQNSFYIDDQELSVPVIETLAATGKLLALHVGADAYEHTHPFRVAKITEQFPDLRILIVHMGGVGVPDMTDAVIEVAAAYSQLTLIGSAVRSAPLLKALRTLGSGRIAFGSDTPFELMHVELARYRALLDEDEFSEEDRHNVLAGNMLRVL